MLDVPNEMPGVSTCRVHVPPMHVPKGACDCCIISCDVLGLLMGKGLKSAV